MTSSGKTRLNGTDERSKRLRRAKPERPEPRPSTFLELEDIKAVGLVVRRAFTRAEIEPPHEGAHQFWHVLACGMLRKGASLLRPEIDALLAMPNRNTWSGRRDHALLLLTVRRGCRR
jgi:hypothetical protein